METRLIEIYQTLRTHFGHQNWWPGDSIEEIIIGAILTQGVSWRNVESAIQNLKNHDLCNLKAIHFCPLEVIAPLLKPALYYNHKAGKLTNFTEMLFSEFSGNLEKLFSLEITELRNVLLSVKGIGPETADSIILYAAQRPAFVIDAYTRRIFSRMGYTAENWDYEQMQNFFSQHLPAELTLFQDFHAQIVRLGKEYCRKNKPRCLDCPLRICRGRKFTI